MDTILVQLQQLADTGYGDFTAKLVPGLPREKIIGVRTPDLRKLGKSMLKQGETGAFLAVLPHDYHEENLLHALLISQEKDFDRQIEQLDRFLPYVGNWPVCDMISVPLFQKHTAAAEPHIQRWLGDAHIYTRRFGVDALIPLAKEPSFRRAHLDWVADMAAGEYYVDMARAWYLAETLIKQYEQALPLFEQARLDKWTHNKAIQKANESFRVEAERKLYLKSLRRR